VFGDDGNDILVGGGGRDDLTGGAGADQFIFAENSGQDRLLDFNPLEDTLILQGLNYQSILQVLAGAFENHGDLIIPLDGADAGFSWPTTDYVRLVGIHAEDLSDANISLVA
jgi:Ca2+-binding RTX toxin-like protein